MPRDSRLLEYFFQYQRIFTLGSSCRIVIPTHSDLDKILLGIKSERLKIGGSDLEQQALCTELTGTARSLLQKLSAKAFALPLACNGNHEDVREIGR